jgi:iron complex outermembrane receptor protein
VTVGAAWRCRRAGQRQQLRPALDQVERTRHLRHPARRSRPGAERRGLGRGFGARNGEEYNVLTPTTTTDSSGAVTMTRFDNFRKTRTAPAKSACAATWSPARSSTPSAPPPPGFELKSRNAYALGDFAGWSSNLYRPVDVAAPSNTFFTGGVLFDPLLTRKSILSSQAVADTLSMLDDSLLLTVGVRRQSIKDYGYDYTTGIQNAGYDKSANTPVAGIVYKPLKNVSLYANYIEALQQGAVASGTVSNLGQIFAPYTSRQKEVGVKLDTGKLGASAGPVHVSQPLAFVQDRIFGLNGEQRNRGLELSVYGMPAPGVRVLGGLTLLDAEQRRTAGGVNAGKDAIGVPETQLNLGTEVDVKQVPGLSLNARAVYTAKQYADAANTQRLPSWTRIDLGANYMTRLMDRDVTLRARVDNAFDRNYWASAGGYPGSGYLVLAAPRTFTVSATVDF